MLKECRRRKRIMHRRSLHLGLGFTALLALAACNRNREPVAPPATTPEGAVRAALVLTRNGDFDGLMRSTLPDADYKAWRAEWERARAKQPPPTPQQRAQFAQMMQKQIGRASCRERERA